MNKNQFERYELLQKLLSKQRLTKQEILDTYEKRGFKVHWKTLNNDLNYMKEQGAEIHIPNKTDNRYFFQEQFIPAGSSFDEEDLGIFKQCIQMLKGINGFHIAADLERVLEKSKYTKNITNENASNIISFEGHTISQGTHYIEDMLYAIDQKTALEIAYLPFTGEKNETKFVFSPYHLKEYRNRWYVIGLNQHNNKLWTVALDRIQKLKPSNTAYVSDDSFNPMTYFKFMIGVTKPTDNTVHEITAYISAESAPYIKSKPIINNQELVKENADGSIVIRFKAYNNYELKQNLLGFGAALKVISPKLIVEEMREVFEKGLRLYM